MNEAQRKLNQEFSSYGKEALEWRRKCELLLPEIERLRVWEACGFSSIYEYAAKKAGMSRHTVNECLRVLRKIEDKPALKEVAEKKGFRAVRPVATIATPETDEFWAEKAEKLGVNTLETYVREERKGLHMEAKLQVSLSIKPELAKRLDQLKKREDFEDLLEKFLDFTEETVPEPVKTKSRHIPVHIKRHVLNKTSGLCAFPGCQKPYKILHHTQRFALEKIHDPTRLVPLCKAHERLAHHGLIQNEEGSPETWSIRKKPDKTHHKFYVDQQVARIRHNAIISACKSKFYRSHQPRTPT